MGNSERYTTAQKNLLKIRIEDLSEAEKKVLRRALLPRKRYIPETEQEGFELARDMLDEEKYANFYALVGEIRSAYCCTAALDGRKPLVASEILFHV